MKLTVVSVRREVKVSNESENNKQVFNDNTVDHECLLDLDLKGIQ